MAAVMVAVLAALGVYVVSLSLAPGQEKPPVSPLPEGLEMASPSGDQPRQAALEIPVSVTPTAGVTCPQEWSLFDNPALHYTICYPPGWGFTDFSTSERLSGIPAAALSSVNIASPETFPYPADVHYNRRSADVKARLDRALTINIETFPPGGRLEGCTPNSPVNIGPAKGLFCEDTYDILPGPQVRFSPSGERHTLKVLVPLDRSPDLHLLGVPVSLQQTQPKSGFQLYIKISGQASRWPEEKQIVWQILNTIAPY